MAIIRNERSSRPSPEPQVETELEEEEIDYSWHPSDEEFTSPIKADQWAELLGDADFAETDAARAMRCLRDYGEPATFQQLSIRYRGTMGRYRRWLNDAAKAAGERYGVSAPQKDQFGMDEWWPLLYRTRATGKPGAGVFEMELRPEVEQAYLRIEEQEKQAKRAENARQLQRIEQLERARQEERERQAAKAAKAEETKVGERRVIDGLAPSGESRREPEVMSQSVPDVPSDPPQAPVTAPSQTQAPTPDQSAVVASTPTPAPVPTQTQATISVPLHARSAVSAQPTVAQSPVVHITEQVRTNDRPMAAYQQAIPAAEAVDAAPIEQADVDLPAFEEYLARVQQEDRELPYWDEALEQAPDPDPNGPIDYAMRYAERLRAVFLRIHETVPTFSVAGAARALGDESVETLQNVLNGESIPSFDYLNKLRDCLFVNLTHLEVADGYEDTVPTFLSLAEAGQGVMTAGVLLAQPPSSIVCALDNSRRRRAALVFSYGPLRCALVGRESCSREVTRELEDYARQLGLAWTTHRVSTEEWDKLAAGRIWPGSLLR